jgi:hypothetical protein
VKDRREARHRAEVASHWQVSRGSGYADLHYIEPFPNSIIHLSLGTLVAVAYEVAMISLSARVSVELATNGSI